MGLRPLHRACANLMLPSVRSLLNAGANPLLSDKRNRLPSEMMKCAKSSKRATSTKVRLARRETIRLIDKVLEGFHILRGTILKINDIAKVEEGHGCS